MKKIISADDFFAVPTKDIVGDAAEEITHIYERQDSFLKIRKIRIKALQQGKRIDICQISDVHFNYLNEEDFAEQNPAVMSSFQNRYWLRGGASVKNAIMALEYGAHCDQTVITGDIMDYYTKGALACTRKYIWEPYPDVICALGGHDITCQMQGTVPDTIPMEEKIKTLKSVWKHDLFYYARILDNRVMLIQMFNDCRRYTKEQLHKLSCDIEKARREQLTVLLFQHEPLRTGNPKDIDVPNIRTYDENGHDYYHLGEADTDTISEKMYGLITSSGDVIKGIFCGHRHNDVYTEIKATAKRADGIQEATKIPQHILTANAYEMGHVMHIIVE